MANELTMQTANAQAVPEDPGSREAFVERCRLYVLDRIEQQPVGETPFYHLFIDQVFPPDLYAALRTYMLDCKYGSETTDRLQDNPGFVNRRFNLFESQHPAIQVFRAIFADAEVKQAFLRKFYLRDIDTLADAVEIHVEFEYFFTQAGRFQNIHVDIPPKYLSFVFYIPEHPVPEEEEKHNATILYDKDLNPHYNARFRANSVCVFAPHFYSYHGFASTIDRDVLVLFYVSPEELRGWQQLQREHPEAPPFDGIRDVTAAKLRRFPLIEYGSSENRLLSEREGCRINARQGRVIRDV